MTHLIGQDAKEAHLLLQGRVLIILEMEVVITYIISITTFKLICLIVLCKSLHCGYTYFWSTSIFNPKHNKVSCPLLNLEAHLIPSGVPYKSFKSSH